MSDTPRTDACAASQRDIGGGQSWWELCAQLERELAAMTAERDAAIRKKEQFKAIAYRSRNERS